MGLAVGAAKSFGVGRGCGRSLCFSADPDVGAVFDIVVGLSTTPAEAFGLAMAPAFVCAAAGPAPVDVLGTAAPLLFVAGLPGLLMGVVVLFTVGEGVDVVPLLVVVVLAVLTLVRVEVDVDRIRLAPPVPVSPPVPGVVPGPPAPEPKTLTSSRESPAAVKYSEKME